MANIDAIKWINTRRSIRKYEDRKISQEEIETLLNAAMHAPSAVNKQPWHFVVIDDKSIFSSIIEIHPHATFLSSASHAILVCGDEELQHDDGYYVVDCSAAVQNILLAANSLGIGSCWIGIHPRPKRVEAFGKLFNIPSHIKPHSLISLGYPAEKKDIADRFRSDRIHFNQW